MLSASRPLFEWAVRRRLRELPGVTILDGHDVAALLTSFDGRQVTGVTLRRLDEAGTHQLAADLVVDASGRGSRAPAWLSAGGYGTPATTQVDPNIAYASRIYRVPGRVQRGLEVGDADLQAAVDAAHRLPVPDRKWPVDGGADGSRRAACAHRRGRFRRLHPAAFATRSSPSEARPEPIAMIFPRTPRRRTVQSCP